MSWERLSTPNIFGGWFLLNDKYFPQGDYFGVGICHSPSYVWRSIWSVKDVIWWGLHWIIGTEEQIPIWDHPSQCKY